MEELEEHLSRPAATVVDALRACPGDVLVLGAGGKTGTTFARMARRAADAADAGNRSRSIIAASRFGNPGVAKSLSDAGVQVVHADLADRAVLEALPDAPNVVFLAGQKFGTRDYPAATWVTNVVIPFAVADRYRSSRIVVLSSGNVYPLVPATSAGARETDPVAPVGEYAATCVGRERAFEHAARTHGTRSAIVRLNYAVDLRYGVLVDVALRIWRQEPVDLSMGHANVIWQGDACAQALQCLPRCDVPPFVINVTGPERLSIRSAALELGRLLGRTPRFAGTEAADALLSDTTRAQSLFGAPSVPVDALLSWVAEWISDGKPVLGKPTHFEEREGRF